MTRAVAKREEAKPAITKGEREDLLRLIKQREKTQKTMAQMRSAELLADFEQQLSTRYAYDQDAIWRKAHEQAQAEVEKANATIAERCKQLGIPKQFAPSIEYHWIARGENAVRDRRTELRTAAKRRVEAIEKSAFVEIEKASVEAQTQLLTHGLTSAAASRFLEQMPPIEALMPSLDMSKIDAIVDGRKGRDRWAE